LLSDRLLADILAADVVLFGAIGGPEYEAIPAATRRRDSLLRIRKELRLFANIRPIKAIAPLADISPLKADITRGVDLVIVRELAGGIYFGDPHGIESLPGGVARGINTDVYTTPEIQRIARVAFDMARTRRNHVTSVDKANVMDVGELWRREVTALHAEKFSDLTLRHLYVDNCAMQIILNPRQFDVVVTSNMFGDILSDCAGTITGSLGMLPSASFSEPDSRGKRKALYEPIHGSAPDIAGQGIANPSGALLSLAMALRHSLGRPEDADLLETTVERAIGRGIRTRDIASRNITPVSTSAFGDAVIGALDQAC
jgi:3-isopropylmalate dehydrogenase